MTQRAKGLQQPENSSLPAHLPQFMEKMNRVGLPEAVQETFAYYYGRLAAGNTGLIHEVAIRPLAPEALPHAAHLEGYSRIGGKLLNQTAMIKLNGGLGTSLGLRRTKSLLKALNGKSFLETILYQADVQNVQLVLMNSFHTHAETRAAIHRIQPRSMPLFFLQHQFPKVLQDDFAPAQWPIDPRLEWSPAGHGDLFAALYFSGILQELLNKGIKYAFVSNADNLGAVVEPSLLGYFAAHDLAFMMEVAERIRNDQKGGHLACRADGTLVLRELAQCPRQDLNAFSDIRRHRLFNTNNIWLHLGHVKEIMSAGQGFRLPFFANPKTLDPTDARSPAVYQIETAMGHAIGLFPKATAVLVPRRRFLPVKKSSDLLIVRSDLMRLGEDGRVVTQPNRRRRLPFVKLDPLYFKTMDGFFKRLPAIPSLQFCDSLEIAGDVKFEPGVIIKGHVRIENLRSSQAIVPGGSILQGKIRFLSDLHSKGGTRA
ncbi:MAG: UTP--glucose-1-phosphate uridylyltransferase [Thermodesulfobacteriota bacterium]